MVRGGLFPLCLLMATIAHAGAKLWSEEDIVTQERASGLAFAPDSRLVWVRTSVDLKEDRLLHHLWLTESLAPGRPLTRGQTSDQEPQVSPDRKLVVFLSERPMPQGEKVKGKQLWALALEGGEPYALTRQPEGVKAFAFADAKTVVFLAEDAPDALARQREKA